MAGGRYPAPSITALHHRNIRCILGLHANDVIATVHVVHLAGDAAAHAGQQIETGLANLVQADAPAAGTAGPADPRKDSAGQGKPPKPGAPVPDKRDADSPRPTQGIPT